MDNLIIECGFANGIMPVSVDEYRELVGRAERVKALAKYTHNKKYSMNDTERKVILDLLDYEVSDNE